MRQKRFTHLTQLVSLPRYREDAEETEVQFISATYSTTLWFEIQYLYTIEKEPELRSSTNKN